MDLTKVIDIILTQVYSNANGNRHSANSVITVGGILKSSGYETYNLQIVLKKVNDLAHLFEITKISNKDGYDLLIGPNAVGYEFFNEYGSYSNFIQLQNQQNEIKKTRDEEAHKMNISNAKITRKVYIVSITFGIISTVISIVSVGFNYFQFTQSQESANEIDSLIKVNQQMKSRFNSNKQSLLIERKLKHDTTIAK